MKNKSRGIAIVGMACQYPDVRDYNELWENVLYQRRAFRKFPENRLGEEYFSDDDDKVYARVGAVIGRYHFDRARFGISGRNFRGTDLTHWMALDVATQALEDSGLLERNKLPKDKTGVFVGNTMTGEFSRANIMRLRWPYVKKKVLTQLTSNKWPQEDIASFLKELEADYKASFPAMSEDSLAGGLSNTIAGRICNYYDFNGGGYTVDGACSSSLLAVIDACKNIELGDTLVSLAGGVDLSLDPFELVGFSRAGALARKEMLVYDKDSNGFWPGEGCGFVVLADVAFAEKNNLKIYALIKGYGISSDGQGGLTRPAVKGQTLALQKAYEKAGYSINEVAYFEGHGTGTQVGDAVELQTIISNLDKGGTDEREHYIGTIKGNIGHTKAAAGIAGLIKIINVVHRRVIPPITGCRDKHSLFDGASLKVPFRPIPFELPQRMKASVSAMGFGGINTHITIEEYANGPAGSNRPPAPAEYRPAFDCTLFLFSAGTKSELEAQLQTVKRYAGLLSGAELTDLSVALYKQLKKGTYRAAIVASAPQELQAKLEKLLPAITGKEAFFNGKDIFFYGGAAKSRIGFLFPGQGSKRFSRTGLFAGTNEDLDIPALYPAEAEDAEDLAVSQRAVVGTSMIAASLLKKLGINAVVGVGHSLGEISALSWSGALQEEDALQLAARRGEAMKATEGIAGLMLIVSASEEKVVSLKKDRPVEIAAINAPNQTVVSGRAAEIVSFRAYLATLGVPAVLLPVKYAFHSSLLYPVEKAFRRIVDALPFRRPAGKIISTVSGVEEREEEQLKKHLVKQLCSPVRFWDAIRQADQEVDLWIEVGGDKTLQNIVKHISEKPVGCLTLDGHTARGLYNTVGVTWVLGNDVELEPIYGKLFARPFDLDWKPAFFTNPCEPSDGHEEADEPNPGEYGEEPGEQVAEGGLMHSFKQMIAGRLELPIRDIDAGLRFLDDLHLNSLEVGQIISGFAADHQIPLKGIATEFANASIQEVVDLLESNAGDGGAGVADAVAGITPWVHYFENAWVEEPLPVDALPAQPAGSGEWHLLQKGPAGAGYGGDALQQLGGVGILVDLADCDQQETIGLLADLTGKLRSLQPVDHVVVVQHRHSVLGFIKSIFLENRKPDYLVVAADEKVSIAVLKAEIAKTRGFREVAYKKGARFTSLFRPVFNAGTTQDLSLGPDDVVLVTGGAKGITAECAMALGKKYKVKLALLGRSDPALDNNLRKSLERFAAAGITYRYYSVDISRQDQVAEVVHAVRQQLGTVTGLIHGAGMNRPIPWHQLSAGKISQTCEAKLYGFRNVTDRLETGSLKLLMGFGSIIAESGMNGNADYALANEWLKAEITAFSAVHPHCKCLNAEWSVWSGAGMGEDLGVLENLMKLGIQPVSLDKGVELFLGWIDRFPSESNLIISGRYGAAPTLNEPKVALPLYRYIEDVKVLYPYVEIIAEFELSEHTDLYLKDHMIADEFVFPAVMGLEAMQQAASVLCREHDRFTFYNTRFSYPIVLRKHKTATVRVLATRISDREIKVVLRCSATDFCKDHFETTLLLDDHRSVTDTPACSRPEPNHPNIRVQEDLYNNLLFHTGIFQVITGYTHLTAYHCRAAVAPKRTTRYFSEFTSHEILSLEPAVRDAALHCVQACVPEYRLLPVGCKMIRTRDRAKGQDKFTVEAVEIAKEDNVYVYNISIRDQADRLVEYWEEARFKVLSVQPALSLSVDLMRVIVARRTDELTNRDNDFEIFTGGAADRLVAKRYDGKPCIGGGYISKTHHGNQTIQVTATSHSLGCDLEKVVHQEEKHWRALLGEDRHRLASYVARVSNEELSTSAVRVWGIMESLKKADLNLLETILLVKRENPYLQYYKCGAAPILSFSFRSRELGADVVFTLVLVDTLKHTLV